MKQGWEIKKLVEVCNVINGLWVGKKEPFINIAVIRNTNFSKDCQLQLDNVAFIDVEVKQFSTRKLLQGDIIIEKSGGSDKQPVGRVVLFNIIDGNYSFSNFTSVLRIKSTVPLIPNFLHKCLYEYYIKGETIKLQSKTTGLRNLNMHAYLRLNIPVPPLSEQERIVVELDLLNDVIAKKREQLKQLDTLAQSIFYDMFGDPITNEKGWETSTIDNVCSSIIRGPFGSALKKEFFVEKGDSTYKVYEQKNAINKNALIGTYYISTEMYKSLSRFEIFPNDIIMSCSGTIGELFVIPFDAERGIINQALLKFTLNKKIEQNYFLFMMNLMKSKMDVKGCGIQNIGSVKYIKATMFGLPPLALQQQFASMIESIEKQKELIKQSLSEVQQLFDSRMDYYFG